MTRLDAPLTLRCGLVLPDRLALAPLTNLQSNLDGTLTDVERHWLLRRAEGGLRVISTCAAFVSEEGHAWPGQLGIARDAHLPGLTLLARDLVAAGAVGIVQLHHGGKEAKLAPGLKLSTVDDAEAGIHGATEEDLARVTADYVAAALRAEAAGFQGVEIHGANGYLFTQFLAPLDNPRTDRWGGDLEGRARLLRQTVQAVRAAVSPGFAVGVRLSPVDLYAARGLVLADSLQLGRWLAEDGVDFVHLSLRDAVGTAPLEPGSPVVSTAFREALPADVALFSVGGVWTRAEADAALEAGADVVVVGKAAMGNAQLRTDFDRPDYEAMRHPWTESHLREQGLGEAFIGYIRNFPGVVVGGAPPRG